MAETAGLAIGVVALAGLFNSSIECFEFVQLGRAFEKNFETAQLRLDTCELRLSRWGASVGLDKASEPAGIGTDAFKSNADIAKAKERLSHIIELFAEAENVSIKFKDRKEPGSAELTICDPRSKLEPPMFDLHSKMRQLAIERQTKVGFMKRARWALYEEKRLRRLIEDVNDLVDGLLTLFPESHNNQEKLCEAEVSHLGENKGIRLLQDVAKEQDKLLETMLKRSRVALPGAQHAEFSGANNQGSQIGFSSGAVTNTFGKQA